MVLQIGKFQIENLIAQNVSFLFIRLTDDYKDVSGIDHLLEKSFFCASDKILETVESAAQSLEYPLVLVCKDGVVSGLAAEQLVKQGYINVYLIAGGFTGLLD